MSAPVKHTCPDIDKVIKWIRDCEGEEIDKYFIKNIVVDLEELREANSKLRNWGESLEEELHEAALRIDDLENTIEELKETINP